jgi:putative membrane protein
VLERLPGLAAQAWGTLSLRPYVFVFLAAFLVLAARDLGRPRAAGFLLWGWTVAFVAEYASTRVGIPFGLYHYTGSTAGAELYLGNVPFFDSLSFPFLAYASFCLARCGRRRADGPGAVILAGILMMLLDVVIDPLAVRGDRWFLGRIFTYPEGGVYFGVPLSNFAGWLVVGWAIVGGYAAAARRPRALGSPAPGAGLYYGVLLFNLAVTLWIGERLLAGVGILIHGGAILLLWASQGIMTGDARLRPPVPARAGGALSRVPTTRETQKS